MKLLNIKYLALVIAVAAMIVGGCSKEDDKDTCPTITVDASTTTEGQHKPGDPLTIKATATKHADGKKIESFKLEYNQDNAPSYTAIDGYTKTGLSSDSETFEYVATFPTKEGSIKYRLTTVDKDGCEVTKILTYTLKNDSVVTYPPNEIDQTLTQTEAYLSTTKKQKYTEAAATGVAADIDITFFWSPTSGNNLVDPVHRGNDILADYKFVLAGARASNFRNTNWTKAQFDALDDHRDIKAVYDGGTDVKVVDNPAGKRMSENAGEYKAGKVVAFVNGAGKYGLIYINSLATSESTGSNLLIKVQP